MDLTITSLLNPFLLIFLATFVPTAFFSALNQKYFTRRQIANSLIISFSVAVLFGLAAAGLHAFIAVTDFAIQLTDMGINLADATCAVLALIIYSILGERFFSDLNIPRTIRIGILVACTTIFVMISAMYSLIPFTLVLFAMLISSAVDGYRQCDVERHILISDDASSTNSEAAVIKNGIELKQKPNIYVLLLESYHSPEAAKHLYDIDDSATVEKLQNLGYNIHKDTYANIRGTIPSLTTLLSGSLGEGSPFILDVLRENGYSCNFFSTSPYIFCNHARPGDFVSFSLPKSVAKIYAFAGPLVSQSKFLRYFAQDIDIFPESINFESCFLSFKNEVLRAKKQQRFNIIHFGATHFSSGMDVNHFKEKYIELFKNASSQLSNVTQFLSEHDPNALVIAVGDHGAMRYNIEPNLQVELQKKGISNKSFALDQFSVLLAVRSSIPNILGSGVISHVNIFRKVFAALGANAILELEPNISSVSGNTVVHEGKVLDPFRQGHGAATSMQSIAKRHKNGSALPSEILQLARMEKHKNPTLAISLLNDILQTQPRQASVLHELGEIHLCFNDAKSCAYLKKAWKLAPLDQDISAMYYLSQVLHSHPEKAEEFFVSQNLITNPEAVKIKLNMLRADRFENNNLEFAIKASFASPNDTRIRLLLAWEYYESCLYQKAEKELQIIIATPKQSRSSESLLAKTSQQALLLLFFTRSALGDIFGAKELFKGNMDSATHRWRLLALSAAFEKQGKINDAICCILDNMNVSVISELTMRIGYLAMRYDISDPCFQSVIESAKSFLTERVRQIEACGFFDATWYADTNMKKGSTEKPLVHYLTHGVYHGMNPTPWFGTVRYIINAFWPWWRGENPLTYFISQGVEPNNRNLLLVDPLIAMQAYTQQSTRTPNWIEALSVYHKSDNVRSKNAA